MLLYNKSTREQEEVENSRVQELVQGEGYELIGGPNAKYWIGLSNGRMRPYDAWSATQKIVDGGQYLNPGDVQRMQDNNEFATSGFGNIAAMAGGADDYLFAGAGGAAAEAMGIIPEGRMEALQSHNPYMWHGTGVPLGVASAFMSGSASLAARGATKAGMSGAKIATAAAANAGNRRTLGQVAKQAAKKTLTDYTLPAIGARAGLAVEAAATPFIGQLARKITPRAMQEKRLVEMFGPHAAKILGAAVGTSVDGGIWGLGEGVSESILGPPEEAAEHIMSSIGTNAMLGFAFGGAISSIGPMLSGAKGLGMAGADQVLNLLGWGGRKVTDNTKDYARTMMRDANPQVSDKAIDKVIELFDTNTAEVAWEELGNLAKNLNIHVADIADLMTATTFLEDLVQMADRGGFSHDALISALLNPQKYREGSEVGLPKNLFSQKGIPHERYEISNRSTADRAADPQSNLMEWGDELEHGVTTTSEGRAIPQDGLPKTRSLLYMIENQAEQFRNIRTSMMQIAERHPELHGPAFNALYDTIIDTEAKYYLRLFDPEMQEKVVSSLGYPEIYAPDQKALDKWTKYWESRTSGGKHYSRIESVLKAAHEKKHPEAPAPFNPVSDDPYLVEMDKSIEEFFKQATALRVVRDSSAIKAQRSVRARLQEIDAEIMKELETAPLRKDEPVKENIAALREEREELLRAHVAFLRGELEKAKEIIERPSLDSLYRGVQEEAVARMALTADRPLELDQFIMRDWHELMTAGNLLIDGKPIFSSKQNDELFAVLSESARGEGLIENYERKVWELLQDVKKSQPDLLKGDVHRAQIVASASAAGKKYLEDLADLKDSIKEGRTPPTLTDEYLATLKPTSLKMRPETIEKAAQEGIEVPTGAPPAPHAQSIYDSLERALKALQHREHAITSNMEPLGWAQKAKRGKGYEVSSQGDKRFSALHATLEDGRTIEEAYQLDVKGYRVEGDNWKLGKGRPPLEMMSDEELYGAYKELWERWAIENPQLIDDLAEKSAGRVLTDKFAKTNNNQARALYEILEERALRSSPSDRIPSIMAEEEYLAGFDSKDPLAIAAGISRHDRGDASWAATRTRLNDAINEAIENGNDTAIKELFKEFKVLSKFKIPRPVSKIQEKVAKRDDLEQDAANIKKLMRRMHKRAKRRREAWKRGQDVLVEEHPLKQDFIAEGKTPPPDKYIKMKEMRRMPAPGEERRSDIMLSGHAGSPFDEPEYLTRVYDPETGELSTSFVPGPDHFLTFVRSNMDAIDSLYPSNHDWDISLYAEGWKDMERIMTQLLREQQSGFLSIAEADIDKTLMNPLRSYLKNADIWGGMGVQKDNFDELAKKFSASHAQVVGNFFKEVGIDTVADHGKLYQYILKLDKENSFIDTKQLREMVDRGMELLDYLGSWFSPSDIIDFSPAQLQRFNKMLNALKLPTTDVFIASINAKRVNDAAKATKRFGKSPREVIADLDAQLKNPDLGSEEIFDLTSKRANLSDLVRPVELEDVWPQYIESLKEKMQGLAGGLDGHLKYLKEELPMAQLFMGLNQRSANLQGMTDNLGRGGAAGAVAWAATGSSMLGAAAGVGMGGASLMQDPVRLANFIHLSRSMHKSSKEQIKASMEAWAENNLPKHAQTNAWEVKGRQMLMVGTQPIHRDKEEQARKSRKKLAREKKTQNRMDKVRKTFAEDITVENYKSAGATLEMLTSDSIVMERFLEQSTILFRDAPDLRNAVKNSLKQRIMSAYSSMPQPTQSTAFGSMIAPNKYELGEWARRLQILNSPIESTLGAMLSGSLTPDMVEALQENWPSIHAEMVTSAMEILSDPEKNVRLSATQRMTLTTLVGGTYMDPEQVQRLQKNFRPPDKEQGPRAQGPTTTTGFDTTAQSMGIGTMTGLLNRQYV